MTRRRVASVLCITGLILFVFLVVSQLSPRTVWIEECNGYCAISQKYGSNENQSYAIVFQQVEFTFRYWVYPHPGITDLPYIAYFTVRFTDGESENLSIASGGFVGVHPDNPLLPVFTNHTNPFAGVATANTEELWGHWVFLVSV